MVTGFIIYSDNGMIENGETETNYMILHSLSYS